MATNRVSRAGRGATRICRNKCREQIRQDCTNHCAGLSVPGKPKQLYDQVKGEGLTVEVLVNNAGFGAAGEALEQPIELDQRMITLDCIALVQLTLLFGKDMTC